LLVGPDRQVVWMSVDDFHQSGDVLGTNGGSEALRLVQSVLQHDLLERPDEARLRAEIRGRLVGGQRGGIRDHRLSQLREIAGYLVLQSQDFQFVDVDDGMRAFMQKLRTVRVIERRVSLLCYQLVEMNAVECK